MTVFREMIKTYRKVLKGDNEEINKVLPNMYEKNFYMIDFKYLKKVGINKLIIDIDGTILPADDTNVSDELKEKIEDLKKDFDICLVSNNYRYRVKPVGDILGLKYLYNAKKPKSICFDKAFEILNTTNKKEVALIGDQMLTDIRGANDYGIYTVLVRPISLKNNIGTYVNRKLQYKIENYLKEKNIFDRERYYKK